MDELKLKYYALEAIDARIKNMQDKIKRNKYTIELNKEFINRYMQLSYCDSKWDYFDEEYLHKLIDELNNSIREARKKIPILEKDLFVMFAERDALTKE